MDKTIIVLLILLSFCLLLLIVFFIQKQRKWKNSHAFLETIGDQNNKVLEKKLNELTKSYQKLLEKKLTAKQALVDFLRLKNYKYEFDENTCEQKARQIILETIDNNVIKVINETSTASIKIDEKIKPRFIGTKGKNIDHFKNITKTDIQVEKKAPFVTICSSNSIRRHLAINTFKHMVKSDAFDQKSIENIYKKEEKKQIKSFETIGKDYILNKLKFIGLNPRIYQYVGRLHYRTSYSQNVLGHCYECALLAEKMANHLSLNPYLAKMCAFFHDLGKSMDQEDGSFNHVGVGKEIAQECNLPKNVIEVIKLHHKKYQQDPYVVLTKIVDTISAGIIGARSISQEIYTKAKNIEDLCNNNKFVYVTKTNKGSNFIKIIIIKNHHYQISDDELQKQLLEDLSKNLDLQDLQISFSFQQ